MGDLTRDSGSQPLAWLYVGLAAVVLFHAVVAFNKVTNLESASLHARPVHDERSYLQIATEGYSLPQADYKHWTALPFSPGYPALLRAFSDVTSLEPRSARLALSSVLFLIACLGLGVLYRGVSQDPVRNGLAIALFAFWPGSFYYLTAYAEALYLPLAVWCLVSLQQKRFLVASALASFALFTRLPAVILVPTIWVATVVDWLRTERKSAGPPGWSSRWRSAGSLVGRLCIYGLVCGLGLAAYVWIIWTSIGDPLGWLKSYDAWSQASHVGFHNYEMADVLRAVLFFGSEKHWPVMIGISFFLVIPMVVFPLRRKLPLDLLAFTVIGWLFLLDRNGLQDPYIDMLRWSSILFPVQYCLAIWIQEIAGKCRSALDATVCLGTAVVLLFGFGYAWLLTRFIHGQWVS